MDESPDEAELNDGLDMMEAGPVGPTPTIGQRALVLAAAAFVLVVFWYLSGFHP